MKEFHELTTEETAALDDYELALYAPQGYTMSFLREERDECREIIANVAKTDDDFAVYKPID